MKPWEIYDYRATWSEEDSCFVSTVSEFPSLSAHGDTFVEAIQELQNVVKAVMEDMRKNKEIIPEPRCKKEFSGKLNIRIPKELHRKLSYKAEEEKISLNQLILYKLSK